MNLPYNKEHTEILSMYKEAVGEHDTFGCLIAGDAGSGKTAMLGTAPTPTLVYMFDPKGYLTLRDLFKEGKCLIVPLWTDQSQSPTEWGKFRKLVKSHIESGFIKDSFASVGVDSLTWALEACANYIGDAAENFGMEKSRTPRPRNMPFMGDYRLIYQEITDVIKQLSGLPVNLMFTGHLEVVKNKEGVPIGRELSVFRKLKDLIPPMFTEKYSLRIKQGVYELLTEQTGSYTIASTQLGKGGLLKAIEKPSIKYLMEKVGMTINEKPPLPKPDLAIIDSMDRMVE